MTHIIEKANPSRSAENPFIVFEGPDGSGKSLVSKMIAEILDLFYYKTPPEAFQNETIMKLLDNEENLIARYFYYLSSMQYANSEVSHILKSSGIVCDRWIDSTQIYHKILLGEFLPEIRDNNNLLIPNLIIVLDVDEEIQNKRLSEREERFDKKWETNPKLLMAIRKEYKSLSGDNIFHINNNATINSTINDCLEIINPHVLL